MLVVHAETDAADGTKPQQAPQTTTAGRASDEHAVRCKQITYSLCMEIASTLEAGGPVLVSREMLQDWFSRLKDANKSISRYARMVATEHDRSNIELHMLKHAVFADILDREASFTETLDAIASTDAGRDKVARAMRFVASVNGGLSALSPDVTPASGGAQKCASMRDRV